MYTRGIYRKLGRAAQVYLDQFYAPRDETARSSSETGTREFSVRERKRGEKFLMMCTSRRDGSSMVSGIFDRNLSGFE